MWYSPISICGLHRCNCSLALALSLPSPPQTGTKQVGATGQARNWEGDDLMLASCLRTSCDWLSLGVWVGRMSNSQFLGMFCRLGSSIASRPVCVLVWQNVPRMRTSLLDTLFGTCSTLNGQRAKPLKPLRPLVRSLSTSLWPCSVMRRHRRHEETKVCSCMHDHHTSTKTEQKRQKRKNNEQNKMRSCVCASV